MTYTAEQLRKEAVAVERMHGETLTVDWRNTQAAQLRAHSDALEENARLRAEANDDDALRERMADILTRTAAALKGEPEPLTLHDWSGLPEIAERAVSELAKLRQKLMRCEHAEAADILHPPQEETK